MKEKQKDGNPIVPTFEVGVRDIAFLILKKDRETNGKN
jgi:hypothetical protein